MAYNFPVGYQPAQLYYPPYQTQQPAQQNQQQGSSLIWIQGEAAAKSYLVAPNNTVALWDSESQTVYLKSCDASGMPSMKVLDYTIREAQKGTSPDPAITDKDFIKRDEWTALRAEIDAIKAQINAKEDKK